MKRLIIVLPAIFLFIACTRPETSENTIKLQKIAATATDYDLEALTEVTDYVFLETNDSCLIRSVNRVEQHNSVYYINTVWALYAFSEEGRYLNSFGKKGRGPGEFGIIKDFAVHREKDLVLLLTYNPNSVYLFTKSGLFLSAFPVEESSLQEIEFGDNDDIVLMCDNMDGSAAYSYLYYNLSGKLLDSRPQYYKFELTPVDGVYSAGISQGLLFRDEGMLYTKEAHSDTSYIVSGRQLVPEYIFNTDGLGFTPEERAIGKYRGQFLRTDWFLHHGEHLIVRIGSPDHGSVVLFRNQKSGNDFAVRLTKKPKEDFGTARLNTMKHASDGEFFINLDAVVLKSMILSNPQSDDALRRFASEIDENSNPVIVRYKLTLPE
jgi:hypothetical protein